MKQKKFAYALKPPSGVTWAVVDVPVVGRLVVSVTGKGEICRIAFLRKNKIADIVETWRKEWPRTAFTPGAATVDVANQRILLVGTPFQQRVWQEMARIPCGAVASYGAIAARVGRPRSARAVGAACGANPVPYLVPCHRVVAGNGGIGGFSSGLDMKKILLAVEGVKLYS